MAKHKQKSLIKDTANHSRTESDYMSALLDTMTQGNWHDVISSTLAAAKREDAQARAWLGPVSYRQTSKKAPIPLMIVVQQLNEDNPLVSRLAKPVINTNTHLYMKMMCWKSK